MQVGQQTIADYGAGIAASTPKYRYVYASYIDEPVLRYEPSAAEALYYHRNQQYSVIALTDGIGAFAERYAYSAYGEAVFTNASGTVLVDSATDNRYAYTGREWDEELSLYHFRARLYDADSGRFCGRDPITYGSSAKSLYKYARATPLVRIDPDGLSDILPGENEPIIWDNDDIRDRCSDIRNNFQQQPDPGSITDPENVECNQRFFGLLNEHDFLNPIWNNLVSTCGVSLQCKNCNYTASAGRGDRPGQLHLNICWNKFRNCKNIEGGFENDWNIIHHEMIHLQQLCTGLNTGGGCLNSLKREVQAYFCANNCGHTYDNDRRVARACLTRALESSCARHCLANSPSDRDIRDFDAWFQAWWNLHGGNRENMCRNPQ